MIQAIETRYAGCRFRSRLEARWAVFFDKLEIDWRYESQGFALSNNTWYLPDFYLPKLGWWIEVKGVDVLSFRDSEKIRCAARDLDGEPIVVLGEPFRIADKPRLYGITEHGDEVPSYDYARHNGLRMEFDKLSWVGAEFDSLSCYSTALFDPLLDRHQTISTGSVSAPMFFDSGKLNDAYTAARSARFEHGESGV